MTQNNTECISKGQYKMYRAFERGGAMGIFMKTVKVNEEAAERLRTRRIHAGYESAEAFAAAHGLSVTTYRSHENGNRNLTLGAAKKYAKLLGTTHYWLLEGRDAPMNLNDSEIAIIDTLKDLLYITLKNGLVTSSDLYEAFEYRRAEYEKKNLPNAADVMKHLRDHVKEELWNRGVSLGRPAKES